MSLDWLKESTIEMALVAASYEKVYDKPTYEPHLAHQFNGNRELKIKPVAEGRIQILWNLNDCETHIDLPVTKLPYNAVSYRSRILAMRQPAISVYGMSVRGTYTSSDTIKNAGMPVVTFKTSYDKAAIRLTDSTLCLEMTIGTDEDLEELPWFSVQLDNCTTKPEAMLLVDRTGDSDCLILLTGKGAEHVKKTGLSAFEALMIEDCNVPWHLSIAYDTYRVDTAYKAVQTWNSMKSYRLPGKAWCRYDHLYKHWAVPKHGKDGYRLISAPRGGLKTEAAKLHTRLCAHPVTVSMDYNFGTGLENTLSYQPGVDYVRTLECRNLSIKKAGRYCLQIDLKDFFTNLQPKTLYNLLYNASTSREFNRLIMMAAPLLGFVKVLPNAPRSTFTSYTPLYTGLLELFTTPLPLWKRELGGYNLEACDGSKTENGVAKHDAVYRDALIKPVDFARIAEFHKTISPYVPIVQRGVPQGAAFSGDIANLAASVIAQATVRCLKDILKDFDREADLSVESVIYSDNIYLFYNAPADFRGIYKREIPVYLKQHFPNACMGNLIKSWKILNFDREKADVKMLGLILDRDGNIRLSRRYRRKINQSIIHAERGIKDWTQSDEGRKNWYLHVKAHMHGNYSRSLVDGSEPKAK